MKYRIEWVTEVVEHHATVLEEKDVPKWLLDILADRESGIAEGEFAPEDEEEMSAFTDIESHDGTEKNADVENRYVSRIASEPPTPAEVGYHSHDALRVAEAMSHREEEL